MTDNELAELREEVSRWRAGYAKAEAYFDQVNEPDEASIGWNGERRELIATGAAIYRNRIRMAFGRVGP